MDDTPPQPTDQSPPPPPGHTGSPTDFLKNVVGKRVIVRLLSGVDYRGMLHHAVGQASNKYSE